MHTLVLREQVEISRASRLYQMSVLCWPKEVLDERLHAFVGIEVNVQRAASIVEQRD